MAKILLWNSIARRRRSISDTFYDNGLGTLRAYLEEHGHTVKMVDWARDDFFSRLSPGILTGPLRLIYQIIFSLPGEGGKKILGALTLPLQSLLSFIQDRRLKRHLLKLIVRIKTEEIKIAGVKLWYGEAFTYARYFIEELKRQAPDVLTVCGGYHTTLYEERLFKRSSFDFGITCEGEQPLAALLNIAGRYETIWDKTAAIESITDSARRGEIDNLIYRDGDQVAKTARKNLKVLSSKTIPKYSMDKNKVRIHVMVESLGCDWGKCNFPVMVQRSDCW